MRYTYPLLLVLIVFVLVNHARAEDCATQGFAEDRLILEVNEQGAQDLWSLPQAQNLSFCISEIFRTNYDNVETAMRAAAAEWMSFGDVDFHLDEDLSCANTGRQVLFEVVPTARQANFKARAFFPSSPAVKRKIKINRRFADEAQPEMQRLMLHELGHVLGFRHEHIHIDAGGDCIELNDTFDPITDYDPASIMHYPTCGPKKLSNFVLSDRDKEGMGLAYPFNEK